MKRLNPETGELFKHGDVREDGYVFISYKKTRIKQDGTFSEVWKDPEKFKEYTMREYAEHRNINSLASKLLKNAKSRSKKYGGTVTITQKWIIDRLEKGVSELGGLRFVFNVKNSIYAPSLDRINSANRDYSPRNCRLILWGENQALNSNSDKEILPILKAMVKAIDKNAKTKPTT